MKYTKSFKGRSYGFQDLKTLLAKASPLRSADQMAGIAADSELERAVAQWLLADLPLSRFIEEPLIAPEHDEVSRLILESHDSGAFSPISSCTVGEFREWLLSDTTTDLDIATAGPGITPEMAAAVSKIMRNQDLIAAGRRCTVITRFRNTIGLPGRLSTRLQPNHPTDDPRSIAASILGAMGPVIHKFIILPWHLPWYRRRPDDRSPAGSRGTQPRVWNLSITGPMVPQTAFTACWLGFGHSGFSPAGFQPQVSRRHRTFFPLEPSLSWRNITRGHD